MPHVFQAPLLKVCLREFRVKGPLHSATDRETVAWFQAKNFTAKTVTCSTVLSCCTQPNRMFTSEMRYEYRPIRAFQQTIGMESSDSNSDGKFIFLSTLALDFARHRRKRWRRRRKRRWMGLIAKLGQRFGADRVDPLFPGELASPDSIASDKSRRL